MKLNIPLEVVEIEINQTYIDADGKEKERVKKIMVPTGRVLPSDDLNDDDLKLDEQVE